MKRTTIMLPHTLKHQAEAYAKSHGISLGELIRQALAFQLERKETQDTFFSDNEVYSGETASDIALNHDDYLY